MRRAKRSIFFTALIVIVAMALLSVIAVAQEKEKQTEKQTRTVERNVIIERSGEGGAKFDVRVAGPQGGEFLFVPGQPFGAEQTFRFISSEMNFDNKIVKNAPFSGDLINESIQTLADGNRIVNRSTTAIARDGQGRVRREQSFNFFGPLGGGNQERKTIHIFDPVSETSYQLDPQNHTAIKLMTFMRTVAPAESGKITLGAEKSLQGNAVKRVQPSYPPVAKAAKAQGPVEVQITVNDSGDVTSAEARSGHPLLRDSATEAARQWKFSPTVVDGKAVNVQGVLSFNFVLADKDPNSQPAGESAPEAGKRINIESKKENLGKQMIEGVEAEGTRIIETIPAGAIGNERPIEIVREHWYSPELQMVVMTRSSDPRFGETTMKLTNVSRSEPDASLFQVPSDYAVKEPPLMPAGVPMMKKRVNIN